MRRTYVFFEYLAAKLYFEDVKLNNLIADDSAENLNFHILWDNLPIERKEFYRRLAKVSIYSDSELAEIFKIKEAQ